MGVHFARTFNELVAAINDGVQHEKAFWLKNLFPAKWLLHSVPHSEAKSLCFPPVDVFGACSSEEKEKLSAMARGLHFHLGAKHYLKLDFLLNKEAKFICLILIPREFQSSHFAACESVGANASCGRTYFGRV